MGDRSKGTDLPDSNKGDPSDVTRCDLPKARPIAPPSQSGECSLKSRSYTIEEIGEEFAKLHDYQGKNPYHWARYHLKQSGLYKPIPPGEHRSPTYSSEEVMELLRNRFPESFSPTGEYLPRQREITSLDQLLTLGTRNFSTWIKNRKEQIGNEELFNLLATVEITVRANGGVSSIAEIIFEEVYDPMKKDRLSLNDMIERYLGHLFSEKD